MRKARVLLNLGDSVTTDHISPAGSIARNSPAARYLADRGYVQNNYEYLQNGSPDLLVFKHFLICRLTPKEFNSYGSRRGNDAVMVRGTFANIRLMNKFVGKPGARTIHIPTNEEVREKFKIKLNYTRRLLERDYQWNCRWTSSTRQKNTRRSRHR